MTTREFFIKRWKADRRAFARVLGALPSDKLDYKPHERSTAAGDLAWQIVEEVRALARTNDANELPWEMTARPPTTAGIVAAFEKSADAFEALLASLDDPRWAEQVKFMMDGKVAFESPFDEMYWGFFLDLIHHRGQLSTYIRPMGGKVPSIYGPSGDDPGE
ncbi:MAG: hypothetical protein HYU52_04845 [Acidobacteria bacterium]|nr:hypothetical protein [Acidobacteriota bacterium]